MAYLISFLHPIYILMYKSLQHADAFKFKLLNFWIGKRGNRLTWNVLSNCPLGMIQCGKIENCKLTLKNDTLRKNSLLGKNLFEISKTEYVDISILGNKIEKQNMPILWIFPK